MARQEAPSAPRRHPFAAMVTAGVLAFAGFGVRFPSASALVGHALRESAAARMLMEGIRGAALRGLPDDQERNGTVC
jgi:hypothetical protein